ncbi:RsmE family RNA methyltransferase [Mesoterricola silvestris]|uniref:Ribosomal RNA small subunit methyltransferase E n=1 Tax=Mesoterricola silvestris TaxID=2927979 RepID=A0AA48KC11_9BACT|nr:RsmE family RNA methyltransferase [Mesoterricola silvestris]BDU74872.1 ribosomal RNA small subunit methyltransferase E [Mesoterricola silvestris]
MSLPRFFLTQADLPREGSLLPLEPAQAKHLWVLRLGAGAALELVLPSGPWKADLAEITKDRAVARLVRPLEEQREPAFPVHAWIPLTAQLSLLDDVLPGLVELGATSIQPVAYERSEYDPAKTQARFERWERIIRGACEQSHRSRIPALGQPAEFDALLGVDVPQRWVAYEVRAGEGNPRLEPGPVAFTSGPEGGITDAEFAALTGAGWKPVTLGGSILRAVTCPVALLGAIRFQNPR